MKRIVAFFAGAAATPVVIVGGLMLAEELTTGLQIECRGLRPDGGICRYDTGPMDETRRIVVRVRWRWHEFTAHGRLVARRWRRRGHR